MTETQEYPDKEILQRLKTIMVLRAVFLTGFVALLLPLGQSVDFSAPIEPLTAVIAGGYLFSIVTALFFRIWNPRFSASLQMLGDLALVGGIIYTTGGIGSPLSFLFLFVIIAASSLFAPAGSYLVASGATIIYGLLIDLEFYGVLHPYYILHEANKSLEGGFVFYLIFLNMASCYCVAYLSSLLYKRLRLIKAELASASKDLEELQAFHRHVVQDMGSGLVTTDADGKLTAMNRAAEEITGYSLEESLGHPCRTLLSVPGFKKLFRSPGSLSLPLQTEGEGRRKDGKTILIRMKISRFSGPENERKGFICVFEDLTEFQELQEKMSQAEQLAAVGRFSAGLAHEIRNPLASLSGSIQMMSKGLQLEKSYQRLMEIVLRETDRLNAILTDFLNYSQPRRNRKTLVDLTQVIQDVIILIKNREDFSAAGNRIDFHTASGHMIINADEEQVKQVIWNLCINGLQSMTDGGRLKISLEKVTSFESVGFKSDKRGYVLTVQDEGCGIAEDQINKIFDPFYTTKENGVGLGLATVYQIVQQNDGTIDVASKEGRGTRFAIFLPRGVAAAHEEEEAVAAG